VHDDLSQFPAHAADQEGHDDTSYQSVGSVCRVATDSKFNFHTTQRPSVCRPQRMRASASDSTESTQWINLDLTVNSCKIFTHIAACKR